MTMERLVIRVLPIADQPRLPCEPVVIGGRVQRQNEAGGAEGQREERDQQPGFTSSE